MKSKPSSTDSKEIDKSDTMMSDDARPSHFFVSSKKVSVNFAQLSGGIALNDKQIFSISLILRKL